MFKRALILFLSCALAVSTLSGCDQTEEGINNGIITGLLAGAGAYFLTSSDSSSGSITGVVGDGTSYPTVVRYDGATGIGLGDTGGGTSTGGSTGGSGIGAGIPGDLLSARFPSLFPLPSVSYDGQEVIRMTRFNPIAYNRPMDINPKDGTLVGTSGSSYTVFFCTLKNMTGSNGAIKDPNIDETFVEGETLEATGQYLPGIDFSSIGFFIDYYDYQGNLLFSDRWAAGYGLVSYVKDGKIQYPTVNALTESSYNDSTNLDRYPECGFYILRPYDEKIYTARVRRISYAYGDTAWNNYNAYFVNVEQFNRTVSGKVQDGNNGIDLYGQTASDFVFSDARVVAVFMDKNDNVVDVQITKTNLSDTSTIDPEQDRGGVASFSLTSLVDFTKFQLSWVIDDND